MKMFGLFSQNQVVNKVVKKSAPAAPAPAGPAPAGPTPAPAPAPAGPASSALKQFNMASIMKMQSTGCKSCRG